MIRRLMKTASLAADKSSCLSALNPLRDRGISGTLMASQCTITSSPG
jgi:hypothetical protein